jgi:hypothetical protein
MASVPPNIGVFFGRVNNRPEGWYWTGPPEASQFRPRWAVGVQTLGGVMPTSTQVIFMACTITSLIMFAAFGVLVVGFTALPRLKGSLRVRKDKAPKSSGGPVIA